jgi:hypothetical protein
MIRQGKFVIVAFARLKESIEEDRIQRPPLLESMRRRDVQNQR